MSEDWHSIYPLAIIFNLIWVYILDKIREVAVDSSLSVESFWFDTTSFLVFLYVVHGVLSLVLDLAVKKTGHDHPSRNCHQFCDTCHFTVELFIGGAIVAQFLQLFIRMGTTRNVFSDRALPLGFYLLHFCQCIANACLWDALEPVRVL